MSTAKKVGTWASCATTTRPEAYVQIADAGWWPAWPIPNQLRIRCAGRDCLRVHPPGRPQTLIATLSSTVEGFVRISVPQDCKVIRPLRAYLQKRWLWNGISRSTLAFAL